MWPNVSEVPWTRISVQFSLTVLLLLHLCGGCVPVRPSPTPSPGTTTTTTVSPITTTTTTTTLPPSGDCCPPLSQYISITQTQFADGVLLFDYNNEDCMSMVDATCTSPPEQEVLNTAIVANTDTIPLGAYLNVSDESTSYREVSSLGTCVGGTWFMGTPPLAIITLECYLINPAP